MAVVLQEQEQLPLPLPFEVGEEVELRSFLRGYRGAWFRCKIAKLRARTRNRKGKGKGALALQCALKYCDFPDQRIIWTSLYEAVPIPKGSKRPTTMELMLRPPFPPFHQSTKHTDSNHQPPSSSSEVTALLNASWRLGDLVDLWCDGCFWSGTIINLHSDGDGDAAVEVQLPPPPVGEGGVYKGLLADLRPSLNWSQENGWSVPLSQANGDSWYTARLLQCSPLAVLHHDSDQSEAHVGNALDPSCILCIEATNESLMSLSAASIKALEWTESSCLARGRSASTDAQNSNPSTVRFPRNKSTNEKSRVVMSLDEDTSSERSRDLADNAGSTDGASTEKSMYDSLRFGRKKHSQNSRRVVCSEDEEVCAARNSEGGGDAIETEIGASIMELEEVANKIRWLKGLLGFGYSSWINCPSATWKFLANAPTPRPLLTPTVAPTPSPSSDD